MTWIALLLSVFALGFASAELAQIDAITEPLELALSALVADLQQLSETSGIKLPELDEEIFQDWHVVVDQLAADNKFEVATVKLGAGNSIELDLKGPSARAIRIVAKKGADTDPAQMKLDVSLKFENSQFKVKYAPQSAPDGRPRDPKSMKVIVTGLNLAEFRMVLHPTRDAAPTVLSTFHFENIRATFHAGYKLDLDWGSLVLYSAASPDIVGEAEENQATAIAFPSDVAHSLRVTRESAVYTGRLIGSVFVVGIDKGFSMSGFTVAPAANDAVTCTNWANLNIGSENNVRTKIKNQKHKRAVEVERTWSNTLFGWVSGGFGFDPCTYVQFLGSLFKVIGDRPVAPRVPPVEPEQVVLRDFDFEGTGIVGLGIAESRLVVQTTFKSLVGESVVQGRDETYSKIVVGLSAVANLGFSLQDLAREGTHKVELEFPRQNLDVDFETHTRDTQGKMAIAWRGTQVSLNYEQAQISKLNLKIVGGFSARLSAATGTLAAANNIEIKSANDVKLDVLKVRNDLGVDLGRDNFASLEVVGLTVELDEHNMKLIVKRQGEGPRGWSYRPNTTVRLHNRVTADADYTDLLPTRDAPAEPKLCRGVAKRDGPEIDVKRQHGVTLIPTIVESVLQGWMSFILRWALAGHAETIGNAKTVHHIVCYLLGNAIYGAL